MSHPGKLKQTGDTHPPEVEEGVERAEVLAEGAEAAPDVPGSGTSGAAQGGTDVGRERGELPRERVEVVRGYIAADDHAIRFSAPTERYLEGAREQVRARPLTAAAAAFAVGFLLAIIARQ